MKGTRVSCFRFRFASRASAPSITLHRVQLFYALPLLGAGGGGTPAPVTCPDVALRTRFGGPSSGWVPLLPAHGVVALAVAPNASTLVAFTEAGELWAVDLPKSVSAFVGARAPRDPAAASAPSRATTPAAGVPVPVAPAAAAVVALPSPSAPPAVPSSAVTATVAATASGSSLCNAGAPLTVEAIVKRLFAQLTRGCGVAGCRNSNCATGSGM